MLSYFQAVVMGLLQGVAELFPISSLGHSILVPAWLGGSWASMVTQQSQAGKTPFLAFVVALHVATAVALIVFYWKDWRGVLLGLRDLVRERRATTDRARLAVLLVAATIPVSLAGLVLDKTLRVIFAKPIYAAVFLTLNGLVLFVSERLTALVVPSSHRGHTGRARIPRSQRGSNGAPATRTRARGIRRPGTTPRMHCAESTMQ